MKLKQSRIPFALGIIILLLLNACNATATGTSITTSYGQVSKVTIPNTLEGTGIIAPKQVASAVWATNGIIGEVAVQLGQQVKANNILMTLDQDTLPESFKLTQMKFAQMTSSSALATAKQAVLDDQTAINTAIYVTNNPYQPKAQKLNDCYTVFYETQKDYVSKLIIYNDLSALPTPKTQDEITALNTKINEASKERYKAYSTMLTAASDLVYNKSLAYGTSIEAYDTAVEVAQGKLMDDTNYLAVLTGQDLPQDQVSEALITYFQTKSSADAVNLRSPIDGIVAEIKDESGIAISTSNTSATIIDRSKLYVTFSLSDTNIVNIKTGMAANVTVTALPDLILTGKVVEISAVGRVTNGVSSYDVKVVLDQAPENVPLNAAADVQVIMGNPEVSLVVPATAIQTDSNGEYVTVVNNGSSQRVNVTSGKILSDNTVVVTGELQEGDNVELFITATTSNNPQNGQNGGFPGGAIMRGGN
jgi:multidrug efflux pump subunit AcrA (membrane-fusion protein)